MSLTILGRSHDGETIWFDAGQGEQELDESQALTLAAAFAAPHPLYPLVQCFCGDADAVQFVDGRPVCHGHAQAYAIAEEGA